MRAGLWDESDDGGDGGVALAAQQVRDMNSNLRSGLLVCKGLELDGLDAHLGCSVYQLARKQKCMKSTERR